MAMKIAIMSGTRNGISAPGEVGQTDAPMETVEMNLQKAIEKIQEDEKNDFTNLQEARIATNAEAAQNNIAVDNEMSEMKQAVGDYLVNVVGRPEYYYYDVVSLNYAGKQTYSEDESEPRNPHRRHQSQNGPVPVLHPPTACANDYHRADCPLRPLPLACLPPLP